jgi:hypothetical protein
MDFRSVVVPAVAVKKTLLNVELEELAIDGRRITVASLK